MPKLKFLIFPDIETIVTHVHIIKIMVHNIPHEILVKNLTPYHLSVIRSCKSSSKMQN